MLPRWSKFLFADKQMDKITLWFEVDKTEICHKATIYIVGTGQEIPEQSRYLSTVILRDFLWHIYSAVENQIRIPQYAAN
jgi:hypothetical protein